jgi:prolyl oligopeptidase
LAVRRRGDRGRRLPHHQHLAGSDPKNRIFYKTLTGDEKPVVELLNKADAEYAFLGNDGPVFWFRTNLNAPVAASLQSTPRSRRRSANSVPQSEDKLNAAEVVGDRFIANYLKDAHSVRAAV